MTDWDDPKTIRVPERQWSESKKTRPDDATHGDCLVAGAKALNGDVHTGDVEDFNNHVPNPSVDTDALVAALQDEISMANEPGVQIDEGRMMALLETIEERTGKLERLLEDLGA